MGLHKILRLLFWYKAALCSAALNDFQWSNDSFSYRSCCCCCGVCRVCVLCGVVCVELLVELLIAICLPAGQHQRKIEIASDRERERVRCIWPNKITSFLAILFLWHNPPFSHRRLLSRRQLTLLQFLLKLITPFAFAFAFSQPHANTAYA